MKIESTENGGLIKGYSTFVDSEIFGEYIDAHLEWVKAEEFFKYLEKEGVSHLTLLQSIYLDNDVRGKGIGTKLLKEFLSQAPRPVILICDNLESQKEGFSLQSFYEKYGFVETGHKTLSGPIMILK